MISWLGLVRLIEKYIDRKTASGAPSKGSVSRLFLTIFLPLALFFGVIVYGFYYVDLLSEKENVKLSEIQDVKTQKILITADFKSIVSELIIFSGSRHLQMALNRENGAEAKKQLLADLESDYLLFSKERGLYDQIRYLDETGMEIARVNYNNGKPAVVPADRLQ
ncbi:MAG: hypothetical protein ACE5EN_11535, partial [Nitrospinota bacterium]